MTGPRVDSLSRARRLRHRPHPAAAPLPDRARRRGSGDGAVREYARMEHGRRRHRRMNWDRDRLWTAPGWQPALASFWENGTGWDHFKTMESAVVRRQAEVEQEEKR